METAAGIQWVTLLRSDRGEQLARDETIAAGAVSLALVFLGAGVIGLDRLIGL